MYTKKHILYIIFSLGIVGVLGFYLYSYSQDKSPIQQGIQYIDEKVNVDVIDSITNQIAQISSSTRTTATTSVENTDVESQNPIPSTIPAQINTNTQIMAWIYPGVPSCDAPVEFADGRKIDVLKAEYFNITSDGQLNLLTTEEGCNGYSAQNLALLKKYSTSQYVTVSSSNTELMRGFFDRGMDIPVETLVSFVAQNNMTGVELDFEDFGSWTQEDYVSYKKFVTLLGNALHAKSKKLMIDGPAVSNSIEENWHVWRYQDFVLLPVDQVVIMVYDYRHDQGVWQPVSSLGWIKDVITWTTQKYPNKNKLVIGLPSYGYRGVEGIDKILPFTYEQIKKEPGFKNAKRDVSSGEMTWVNGDFRYFYQDSESLNQKRAVVESLGIKSISVWHLGGNQWFAL